MLLKTAKGIEAFIHAKHKWVFLFFFLVGPFLFFMRSILIFTATQYASHGSNMLRKKNKKKGLTKKKKNRKTHLDVKKLF
jgi:hypothetical protein